MALPWCTLSARPLPGRRILQRPVRTIRPTAGRALARGELTGICNALAAGSLIEDGCAAVPQAAQPPGPKASVRGSGGGSAEGGTPTKTTTAPRPASRAPDDTPSPECRPATALS